MNEKEIFGIVFEKFQEMYNSQHNLHMEGSYVYCDDELKFNTDGYNLHYNLSRLCHILQNELY